MIHDFYSCRTLENLIFIGLIALVRLCRVFHRRFCIRLTSLQTRSLFEMHTAVRHAATAASATAASVAPRAAASTAIVWFKMDDLRLADHEPLHEAHRNASHVLHAFVFDPFWFGRTSFGFPKTGHFRAKFLLESLVDLRKSLASAGSSLVVRTGHTPDVLASLAASVGATAVYSHAEACSEELAIEAGVRKALKGKAELHTYWGGRTMYHAEDLPFKVERVPQVFTQFRRAVEAAAKPRPPLPVPRMKVSQCARDHQINGT